MTIERAIDIISGAGGSAFGVGWVVIKGLLLWGLLGVVAALLLYLASARLGWLDAAGSRKRWARVTFGLVLFMVLAPGVAGVGTLTQLRNKIQDVLLDQLGGHGASEGVGHLLMLPVLITHDLADTIVAGSQAASMPANAGRQPASAPASRPAALQMKRKLAPKKPSRFGSLLGRLVKRVAGVKKKKVPTGPDVSFLLKADKQGLVKALTGEAAHRVLRRAPLYRRIRASSALRAFAADFAVDHALKMTDEKIGIYTQLFTDLQADGDGKLRLSDAAEQVGRRFFERALIPVVARPFDTMRMKLIIAVVIVTLIAFGGIRFGLRRSAKRAS